MNTDRLLREVEKRLEHPRRGAPGGSPRCRARGDRPRAAASEVGLTVESGARAPGRGGDPARDPGGDQPPGPPGGHDRGGPQAARPHRGRSTPARSPCSRPDGRFRIIAARGFPDPARRPGRTFRDALHDALRDEPRGRLALADVTQRRAVHRKSEAAEPSAPGPGSRCWSRARSSACSASTATASSPSTRRTCTAPRRWPSPPRPPSARPSSWRRCAATRRSWSGSCRRPGRVRRRAAAEVARVILDGALRIGSYAGGAAAGGREGASARPRRRRLRRQRRTQLPPAAAPCRHEPPRRRARGPGRPPRSSSLCRSTASTWSRSRTPDVHVGTLVLVDPDGESAGRPADGGLRLARGRRVPARATPLGAAPAAAAHRFRTRDSPLRTPVQP